MKLTKKEAARREEAALAYFRKNPEATVADLNAGFKDGSVTGKKELTLNSKKSYLLRKQARHEHAAKSPPEAKAARRLEATAPALGEEALPFSSAARQALQTIAAELPKTNLEEVTVRRDGSFLARERVVKEHVFSLG